LRLRRTLEADYRLTRAPQKAKPGESMDLIEVLGYAASASVLITFCMSTMVPLRAVAICSNVLFASYGALAHIYPVLILHSILLPVNSVRLYQILNLIKRVRAAELSELSVESLLPLMSKRRLKNGEVLIRKGDKASSMFYLASGTMKIVEIGKTIGPGAVLGEIGIFARDQKRTATVECVDDCEVYEISESRTKQLYFQNPAFGFAVMKVVIGRLAENASVQQAAAG
jgi:CRP/FNR family transcriptional regulator, cyclic AMP receptor protein